MQPHAKEAAAGRYAEEASFPNETKKSHSVLLVKLGSYSWTIQ